MPSLDETPTKAQLCAILALPESAIPDEALPYALSQLDPDADFKSKTSAEAKQAESALDLAAPDFPKDVLKQHYAAVRAEEASALAVQEEAAALAKIQERKLERELLSPKSKKAFDADQSDAFWAAQDGKTKANTKNIEIAAEAAAAAAQVCVCCCSPPPPCPWYPIASVLSMP
jgi:hypothetical protein